MTSYADIIDHHSMMFDERRNRAYYEALKKRINPQTVVLDLGAGLGLHGLMAAKLGARHVYLVEPSPVINIAEKVVEANGISEKVTIIKKPIEVAEIASPIDLIVSVFTGNFLLEEDLLPSLFFARDRFLKLGGELVPDHAKMHLVPVSAERYFNRFIGVWSKPIFGIDYSEVVKFASNSVYFDHASSRETKMLAMPAVISTLDLGLAAKAECRGAVTFVADEAGTCHGFVGWSSLRIGDSWLTASPEDPQMHWSQVFLPLNPPIQLKKGDTLSIDLSRPQFGEWSWTVSCGGTTANQSTFYSRALSLDQLRCHAGEHMINRNESGELVSAVLEKMTGSNSVTTIRSDIQHRFGGTCSSAEDLDRKINKVLTNFGK